MNLAIISRNATPCNAMHLQAPCKASNIHSTTKILAAFRTAVNRAFFMPKIHGTPVSIGMKRLDRILKNMVELMGRNTRPFMGNTSSRLRSVVQTRPPVFNADGQTLTKILGGLPMANTSHAPTVGQFEFNINLPANSFIKRFSAVRFLDNWQIVIDTESGQIATLKDPSTQRAMEFPTLDHLADWLGSQGVPEMNVFLPAGNCGHMVNNSMMRGAA